MKLAGVILAAGASRRMGSPKALLPWQGETFLDRLIRLLAPCCGPVIVVVGEDAEKIRSGIERAERVQWAVNPAPERGQLSSLQIALRQVPGSVEGVIFCPVDHPDLESATVRRLAEELAAPGGRPAVVIPRYHGRRGHPVAIARPVFADFLRLRPEARTSEGVHANRARTRFVEVPDAGILRNVNDPEQYRRLIEATGGGGAGPDE